LGNFGTIFGVASLVKDEFLDMLDYSELQNRWKNECPPLPMLYALENSDIQNSIEKLLDAGEIKGKNYKEVSRIILASNEAKILVNNIKSTIDIQLSPDPFETNPRVKRETVLLLKAAISGL
jgi:hypothetical protein